MAVGRDAADGDAQERGAGTSVPASPRVLRRKSPDEVTLLEVPVEGDYDREKAAATDVLVYNAWGRRPPMVAVRTWSKEGEHFRVVARALGEDHRIQLVERSYVGHRTEDVVAHVLDATLA